MYALNLASDGRILSATTANHAPAGAVFVSFLPDGDISEYRYSGGEYIHDPLPKEEEAVMTTISADELAVLQEKSAAYDILTKGESE